MDSQYIKESVGADSGSCKDRMLVKALMHVYKTDPKIVEDWIESMRGESRYNNYLSECEANSIVEKFKNANGSSGPVWTFNEIKNAVNKSGLNMEEAPYFNDFALYVTLNMFVSDQYKTLVKWIGSSENKMFEVCYDLAYNQLKDIDRPNWIRHYFDV